MNFVATTGPSNLPALRPASDVAPLLDAPAVGSSMRLAYLSLLAFAGIFILWSLLAPVNSAAIAPGLLRPEGGGRKVVQHLEGGIVKQILVREGDVVRAGQRLVTIDLTQTGARDASLQANYDSLLAQEARLTAERQGLSRVNYPRELLERASDPTVRELISASNALFAARHRALTSQLSVLEQRLLQTGPEIASYEAQLSSLGSQGNLLREETTSVAALVDEGLERRSRLLALQRQVADTDGQRGQLQANIARARQATSETRAQMAVLRQQMLNEAAAEQREVRTKLADLRETLAASRDVVRRHEVVAPVAGSIVNLRTVTPGGVIGAGEPILDIVPSTEKIVVVARLSPNDVDVVHPGLRAEVRLTPYKARLLPLIHGTVRKVSADAMVEEQTGEVYYEVEIELNSAELRGMKDVRPMAGMPAEVFIDLGARTLLQYLTQPLIDSFHRAWREP